ncbi:toxin-antitoxin system YwqK family antitoxin [Gammaproteobacteria bacterium]|nr:toxin-antitoxin system YwqK family antitoxin [Gammaproteobacteria bacterium]
MKKLLSILCLLITASCSKEVSQDQLVERGFFGSSSSNRLTYEINSQTPFSGMSIQYYKNGQLKDKANYKEGKKEGLSQTFYSNGQVEYETTYKGGERVHEKWYYEIGGRLKDKTNYKDGKREGLSESYFGDGSLNDKSLYKNGKLDGLQKVYRINESGLNINDPEFEEEYGLHTKRNYKDGKLDGLYEYSEPNGPWSKKCYKNDQEVAMSYCEK